MSKGEPVKHREGKLISTDTFCMFSMGAITAKQLVSDAIPHEIVYTLHYYVYRFCVIMMCHLCSMSQLPGCIIASDLLLPRHMKTLYRALS